MLASFSNHHSDATSLGEEGFALPLNFDNSSDYLFARLFLNDITDGRIPWKFCDTILSTLRDPRFDLRKITFKDCKDMYARVGGYRDKAWSLVEARGGGRGTNGIPEVVLDGVFDALRLDLHLCEERGIPMKGILENMALVHSSWHGRARRLLGYSVSCQLCPSLYGPFSPQILQNSSIGGWTRELRLTYRLPGRLSTPSARNLSNHDEQFQQFVSHLRTRIPCVCILHLEICRLSNEIPDTLMQSMFKAVSSFTQIEDLTITLPNFLDFLPRPTPATQHDALQLDEFTIHHDADHSEFKTAELPELLSPFASLPKLRSIVIKYNDKAKLTPVLSRLKWCRNPDEHHFFIADELDIRCLWDSFLTLLPINPIAKNANVRAVLHSARVIEFHEKQREPSRKIIHGWIVPTGDLIGDAIVPFLEHCTSAHRLVFRGYSWSHTKLFRLLGNRLRVPSAVTELLVVSCLPQCSPKHSIQHIIEECSFQTYDEDLARALGVEVAPSLRVLKVLFTDPELSRKIPEHPLKSARETVVDCARHYAGAVLGKATAEVLKGPDLYEHILPLCKQKCIERGINFKVDVDC